MDAILSESDLQDTPELLKTPRVEGQGLAEYLETIPSGILPRDQHTARAKGGVGLGYRSPYSYSVGREKIRDYARCVFDEHPVYYNERYARDNDLPALIAPPTFLGILGIIAQRPLTDGFVVGYDVSQIMQTEQRIKYHRPIYTGDELFIDVIFDSFREMAGTDIITIRNEVFNQDDLHILSSWTTIVARVVDHENKEIEETVRGVTFGERKILQAN